MPKKTTQRTIRFEAETIEKLDAISQATGVEAPKIIRSLVLGAHDFFKREGYIQLPFRVVGAERGARIAGVQIKTNLDEGSEPDALGHDTAAAPLRNSRIKARKRAA